MALSILFAAALAMAPAPPAPPATPRTLSHEARAGDLQVLQLWSDDAERFLGEWAQPTPPQLTTTTSIERNRQITLFLIFGGCRADAEGNCHLTGRIAVLDPDGAPYNDHADVAFWDNQPAPPAGTLALSPQGLGLIIEDGEKLGPYTVRVSVTDVNAGVTADTEQVLTVVEAGTLGNVAGISGGSNPLTASPAVDP